MLFNLRSFFGALLWTTKPESISPAFSPNNLAELPTELLAEVMQLLDWNDVLRMRQICRRLNHASYERSVWLSVFLRHSAAQPCLFRLEKALPLHSSAELETLILRWKAVDKHWSLDGARPTLSRTFTLKRKAHSCSHLVTGGRWFIAGTIDGDIQYFDLDASDPTPRLLIPSPFHCKADRDRRNNVHMRISVDMDFDSPGLVFHLAVFTAGYGNETQRPRHVQVWRIQADSEESGHVFGLSARKRSAFLEEGNTDICHISLLKEKLAYSIRHFGPKPTRFDLVVVNWTEANDCIMEYPRRVVPDTNFKWISLALGNQVVCASYLVRIFNLDDLQETTLPPSNLPSLTITSQRIIELHAPTLSQPFLMGNSTRFLYTTAETIGGLIVHKEGPAGTEVEQFYKGDVHADDVQLGYNSGIALEDEQRVVTFRTSWHDQDSKQLLSIKDLRVDVRSPRSFVDDVSGRIVLTTLHGYEHTLVEFT